MSISVKGPVQIFTDHRGISNTEYGQIGTTPTSKTNVLPLKGTFKTGIIPNNGNCIVATLQVASLIPQITESTVYETSRIYITAVRYGGYPLAVRQINNVSLYALDGYYDYVNAWGIAVGLSDINNGILEVDWEYSPSFGDPMHAAPVDFTALVYSLAGVRTITDYTIVEPAAIPTINSTTADTLVSSMLVYDPDSNVGQNLFITGYTDRFTNFNAYLGTKQSSSTTATYTPMNGILTEGNTSAGLYGGVATIISLNPGTTPGNIDPYDSVTVSASTTSASGTLPPGEGKGSIKVTNGSSSIAYVRWGSGAQTAVATDTAVAPNSSETFKVLQNNIDTVAVKLQTGTGSVVFQRTQG